MEIKKDVKYKLVALDVDGTLLNSKREIPEENITTIKALAERGIKFIITTGRPDLQAVEFTEKLGISPIILGNNGATVRDAKSRKLYHATYLPAEKIKELHKKLSTMDIYYRIYGLDSVYTFYPGEFDDEKNEFAHFSRNLAKIMDFKILNSIEELEDRVIKFVCFSNDYEKLLAAQALLSEISGVEIVRGGANVLDVTAENISKGRTLLKYAKTLGIEKEEIVAIGDGENDLEMLKLVGFSVTLENGEDILKEIAHMITVSNDEAGVSKALSRIFLENRK